MAETNCVYRVDDAELTPCEDYSGQIPRYDMLQDEQVCDYLQPEYTQYLKCVWGL